MVQADGTLWDRQLHGLHAKGASEYSALGVVVLKQYTHEGFRERYAGQNVVITEPSLLGERSHPRLYGKLGAFMRVVCREIETAFQFVRRTTNVHLRRRGESTRRNLKYQILCGSFKQEIL